MPKTFPIGRIHTLWNITASVKIKILILKVRNIPGWEQKTQNTALPNYSIPEPEPSKIWTRNEKTHRTLSFKNVNVMAVVSLGLKFVGFCYAALLQLKCWERNKSYPSLPTHYHVRFTNHTTDWSDITDASGKIFTIQAGTSGLPWLALHLLFYYSTVSISAVYVNLLEWFYAWLSDTNVRWKCNRR